MSLPPRVARAERPAPVMHAMKQALKKLLPRPALHAVHKIRAAGEARTLATLTPLALDADNLLPATAADLSGFLNTATPFWEEDRADIIALLGDDDRAGGVNPGDRRALYALITALQPLSVLEIGTHIGASTQYIARALARGGNGILTTVDIYDVNDPAHGAWRAASLSHSPQGCAQLLGTAGRVRFVTAPALAHMRGTADRYDFIFLDGDHRAPAVYAELAAALARLNPGGVIVLHDYYPGAAPLFADGNIIAGPFHALRRAMAEQPALSVLPLGALPWPTKLGSHVTSLAMTVHAASGKDFNH